MAHGWSISRVGLALFIPMHQRRFAGTDGCCSRQPGNDDDGTSLLSAPHPWDIDAVEQPRSTTTMAQRCGSGSPFVVVTVVRVRAVRVPGSGRPGPGSRQAGQFAAGPGNNDGPPMLLSPAGQPQPWPIDVVPAATMTHRCGYPPRPDSIGGPSLRFAARICPLRRCRQLRQLADVASRARRPRRPRRRGRRRRRSRCS